MMRGLILGAAQGKAAGARLGEEGVKREDRGYRLKKCDIQPFLGFRKVHIVIQSQCPLHAV